MKRTNGVVYTFFLHPKGDAFSTNDIHIVKMMLDGGSELLINKEYSVNGNKYKVTNIAIELMPRVMANTKDLLCVGKDSDYNAQIQIYCEAIDLKEDIFQYDYWSEK